MRGPIMSRGRSQLLCQEGTSQTNLIWLSPSFSFPLPSRSLSANPDSFSAEWVFSRSFEGQRKTLKRGASLGLWPLIATTPLLPCCPVFCESHRRSHLAQPKGRHVAEKQTTSRLAARLWQKKSCAEVARDNGTVWEEEVRRAQSSQ